MIPPRADDMADAPVLSAVTDSTGSWAEKE